MMDVSGRVLAITQALGDPLRLAVLQHLMGGPASVSELMTVVGAEQSRLSNHLAVLRERGLVRASRHGRQVLYELHDRAVARLIESLAQIGGPPTRAVKSAPVAHARTCYDHVAGRLGVAIFEALVAGGALKTQKAAPDSVALAPKAGPIFEKLGVDLEAARQERRRFATACLDWTERRPHLGGALGAAILGALRARGYVRRRPRGRDVKLTKPLARWLAT